MVDEFDEQNMDNKDAILEIPWFLLFSTKKNKDKYVFKKNAENFWTLFNVNIAVFAIVVLLSQLKFITQKSFTVGIGLSLALAGIILLMTGIMIYLSMYFTKKSPYKTKIFLALYYFVGGVFFSQLSDVATDEISVEHDGLEFIMVIYMYWIACNRIFLFKHLLFTYIPIILFNTALQVYSHW